MTRCFVHTRRKQINTNKAVNESGAPVSETDSLQFCLFFQFWADSSIEIFLCPSIEQRLSVPSHTGGVCFYLDLLGCPLVQIDRFDSGDVDAEVTVDPSTADTHEHPEVPGSPSRTWNRRDVWITSAQQNLRESKLSVWQGLYGRCSSADAEASDGEHRFHRISLKSSQRGEINSGEMKTLTHRQVKAGMDELPLSHKQGEMLKERPLKVT